MKRIAKFFLLVLISLLFIFGLNFVTAHNFDAVYALSEEEGEQGYFRMTGPNSNNNSENGNSGESSNGGSFEMPDTGIR